VAACSDKWDYTSPDSLVDGSAISSTVRPSRSTFGKLTDLVCQRFFRSSVDRFVLGNAQWPSPPRILPAPRAATLAGGVRGLRCGCSDKWDYTSPDYRDHGSAISSMVNYMQPNRSSNLNQGLALRIS
jgi:hypothetical protein